MHRIHKKSKNRYTFCSLCPLLLGLALTTACGVKPPLVEKVMENGHEVVLNHIQPYRLPGEPETFSCVEEFVIDTEDESTAALGLTDIGRINESYFDVDSRGNVFVYCPQNAEHVFYKFDRHGAFLQAFGRKGQGPGEFQGGVYFKVLRNESGEEELVVTDTGNSRLSYMGTDGTLIHESRLDSSIIAVNPLGEGRFLVYRRAIDASAEFLTEQPLTLTGPDFEDRIELDRQRIPNPITGERLKGIYYVFSWDAASGRVYTGFQERGYEIYVYDYEGHRIRTVRKEFTPVPVPEDHKAEFMSQFEADMYEPIRRKIYFPDTMPPFFGFMADEEGRLLVMTYEEGPDPGEYWYDIFNPDGVFIGRKSLRIYHDEFRIHARMKDDMLYRVEEKENGFKRFVASRVNWQ